MLRNALKVIYDNLAKYENEQKKYKLKKDLSQEEIIALSVIMASANTLKTILYLINKDNSDAI